MSRYGSDYPPRGPERWDRRRFEAASRGGPPVMERERERDFYEEVDYYPSRRRQSGAPEVVFKEEEHERYDGPRRASARPRFYEEEERDVYAGAMVHRPRREPERERDRGFEIDIREREYERDEPPSRPRFVRRQSSLDTYDRKPMPRYGDRVQEQTVVVPFRQRHSPRRYRSPPRHDDREYERDYEDIRIAEPDYYGDDGYRGYREVEISRVRRNNPPAPPPPAEEEEVVEEKIEEVVEEREFPRRGKTRMPMRLVEKKAVIELGYPFEEEGETLIILKALGKEHIDEVIKRSREIKKSGTVIEEKRTTYVYDKEEPSSPPPTEGKVIERRTEIIREGTPPADVPRSVREWDVYKSKSRRGSASSSDSSDHKTETTHRRSSHHGSHHSTHRRSRSSVSTKREVVDIERDESATIRAGLGALTLTEPSRRSSKSIQREIRALEAEKRALQLERDTDDLRGESRSGEIVIAREKADKVEIRKDKKAPDPRIIRAMLATLT